MREAVETRLLLNYSRSCYTGKTPPMVRIHAAMYADIHEMKRRSSQYPGDLGLSWTGDTLKPELDCTKKID